MSPSFSTTTKPAEQKLEALLMEGLNSGTPLEISSEYWETKRQQLIERHAPKKGETN